MIRSTLTSSRPPSKLSGATLAGLVVSLLLLASPVLAASPAEPDLGEQPEVVETPATECPSQGLPSGVEGEPLLSLEEGGVVYTAGGCSAWATCYNGTSVHCSSSSSSGSCSYQNANCPTTQGWVLCDGARTWCPACPVEDDCSRFNYPGCSYFWNGVLGCCDVKSIGGAICLQAC